MLDGPLSSQLVAQADVEVGEHLLTAPVNGVTLTPTKVETSEVGEAPLRPVIVIQTSRQAVPIIPHESLTIVNNVCLRTHLVLDNIFRHKIHIIM